MVIGRGVVFTVQKRAKGFSECFFFEKD
ncbi:Protein CBG26857 [Caenorhabditis briggsae]|uniref:Protein CBG26857 n=1 Tax=Caenorhabditis briggsae TaxID=6238 RepID=B6II58_CAEBR|nr:Protein CBG26857 [Caenorhabditis briggsae]CAR99588.1 Protein CBG26857 [Caenorhabditis briggsae]